ncbi:mss1p [Malassezia pachydermatis]|uniref:Mss1p n=1 Tax=Malassezia pachydermatis TaxID=77020 RepID=A0A0M9VPG4_9BASI|nr:mss1p [Malassezia pachydermatis]KOS14415.1 mss1p [Malassezia pachydermatis]
MTEAARPPTIYALSSGATPSAIAIVRIAGEHTLPIYEALCRRTAVPPARRAVRQTLYHPLSNDVLDDALVLYFPPSRSFTGDAVLELQLHGSPAVVRDVLSALNDLAHARSWPDLRPAEPGEFTRRAFEHGRMDLTACEALDALLRAETSEQRRLAQRAGHGRQAQMYHTLRSRLLDCMAQLEALLDFADEDDIDMQLWDDVHRHVREIRTYLAHELQLDMPSPCRSYAEAVMQGVRIALYGRTNVGKSSLLNRLVQREAAIVTSHPGTTRDVIEVQMELHGYKVTWADTAGLRDDTNDPVEQIGIARTQAYVSEADLAIRVCTPADMDEIPAAGSYVVPTSTVAAWGIPASAHKPGLPVLLLINKMDTLPDASPPVPSPSTLTHGVPCHVWHTSVVQDQGVHKVVHDVGAMLASRYAQDASTTPLVTQARHRHCLLQVVACLDTFLAMQTGPDLVVAAEELRRAAQHVGAVTGQVVTTEDVLGTIFARFCIGK